MKAASRTARGSRKEAVAARGAGRPARMVVAVDVVLLTVRAGALYTVAVRRSEPPFRGVFALPGGVVRERESLECAAARVLSDRAGIRDVFLEQLYTFGRPTRDGRGRAVSVAYYALVDDGRFSTNVGSRGVSVVRIDVPWAGETGGAVGISVERMEPVALAFDHAEILGMAVKRIRGKLDYAPIGYQLLPTKFTLFDLQGIHEAVLGRSLNKDSFRRRMLASGDLEATGDEEEGVDHRPAALYRFARRSAV